MRDLSTKYDENDRSDGLSDPRAERSRPGSQVLRPLSRFAPSIQGCLASGCYDCSPSPYTRRKSIDGLGQNRLGFWCTSHSVRTSKHGNSVGKAPARRRGILAALAASTLDPSGARLASATPASRGIQPVRREFERYDRSASVGREKRQGHGRDRARDDAIWRGRWHTSADARERRDQVFPSVIR